MRIEPGKCWTFVTSTGDRVAYVVEEAEPADSLGARVRLRNVATRGIACVTWDWMLRGEHETSVAHWEYAEGAEAVLPEREEVEPLVVFHMGASAVIGPAGAWERGDRVVIPARGPKHGDDGLPSVDGVVNGIALDGLARVVEYVEEEIAA